MIDWLNQPQSKDHSRFSVKEALKNKPKKDQADLQITHQIMYAIQITKSFKL